MHKRIVHHSIVRCNYFFKVSQAIDLPALSRLYNDFLDRVG